ncbi:MAG: ferritin-like domain-containing protein [Ilumatobacteraceae bacterium]
MNHDHIRREARASELAHRASMPAFTDAVSRFLDRGSRSVDETSGVLLGGLTRRNLLRVGGLGIAGATVLAACGSGSELTTTTASPSSMATDTTQATNMLATDTTMADAATDVTLLRTASSIEHLAVAAYQIAIDSGLVTTAAVGSAAQLFQSHHLEHAAFFEAATKAAGGDPFTEANAAVLAQLQPTIDGLKDETGVLQLALALERAAAATYQSGVGTVTDRALNKALMSVGGVEARHAAVLAGVLAEAAVPLSFGTPEGAIPVGTGV